MFAICIFIVTLFVPLKCQEYDFAAEMTRQCLVPDPVGLLDCVENRVTLPYLQSWVDCTNSLGQNVRTSADIINYRCKSVWEGKGLIPEVFYIKDCVIEKTGLPAKNVSAEVLGAYKECEKSPAAPPGNLPQTRQPQQLQNPISMPIFPVGPITPYSQQHFVINPQANGQYYYSFQVHHPQMSSQRTST